MPSTGSALNYLSQLGGMLRYEMLIEWRVRRWMATTLVMGGVGIMILLGVQEVAAATNVENRARLATATLFAISPALHLFGLIIPAILFADALPRDRQWKLGDLLGTLPVPDGLYLCGKLLAVALSVAAMFLLTGLMIGVACWVLVNPFDVGEYAILLLAGVVPVSILSASLAMLLAAGQGTRRQAIMLGVVIGVVCLLGLGLGVVGTITLADYFNPARTLTLRYYLLRFLEMSPGSSTQVTLFEERVTFAQVQLGIAAGLVEVAAAWVIAWWWLRRQRRQR